MRERIRDGGLPFPGGRRLVLLLGIGSVLGTVFWLWWTSARRADTNFLPHRGPAEWILYPTPPQGTTHPRVEISTAFRREFNLEHPPAQASLRVAAFRGYTLTLNGVVLQTPAERGANWKQPDRFEVAKDLRAGRNEIVVNVFNSNGPPALWLALVTVQQELVSSEEWTASCAGASWRPARLGKRPMVATAGSELSGGDSAWAAVQRCWPVLLIFAAVSTGGWWLFRRKGQSLKIGRLQGDTAVFVGLAVLWAALFANNLGALPPWDGFDAAAHMEYIRYIMEHKALPLGNEGYEMFQPPFYYVLCAGVLKLCHLSLPQRGAVMALRVLGMGIGIAHFFLVWGSLRLLFPQQRTIARWGGVLAACLPVMVYLSQYVTNEAFAAACVSGCVCLCLWVMKQSHVSWKHYCALGCCLGAAMLAKSTALLVLPPAIGALLWRALESRTERAGSRNGAARALAGSALMVAVCLTVCGWHYWRTWKNFGSPFLGVWDPRLGYSYWQDEGYRTASFFLRFGGALVHPWFSGLNSFADGIYSTLWGDGLLGGTSAFNYHPPWNYDLMNAGYWLALLPASAAVIGAFMALKRFVLTPRPEWFLVLGLGFLGSLALLHMSLVVPQWCMIKAFYALCALIPFCACAGLGMSWLVGRSTKLQPVLVCWFALWGLTSLGAFWIPYQSAGAVLAEARTLRGGHRFAEAANSLATQLQRSPQNLESRSLLVDTLMRAGELDAAMEQANALLQNNPNSGSAYMTLAALLAARGQTGRAIEEYRRAVELAPGLGQGWQELTKLLLEQGRLEEAEQAAQDGLAADPYGAILHYYLGTAKQGRGETEVALGQFILAARLSPKLAAPRASLGAISFAQGRLEEAADHYTASVELDPNNADLQAQFGKLLTMQGRLQDATNHLNTALRLQPGDPGAHCQLAVALEKAGDLSGAMVHYAEALRLEPGLTEASENLAKLKQRQASGQPRD